MGSTSNVDKGFNEYLNPFSTNLNPPTRRKTTKLHYAAHDGDCDRINTLLKEGYDLEARDSYGRTPLLRAALKGHVDAFDLLLRYGADFNAHDDWRRFSEHLAAKENHYELLTMIIEWASPEVLHNRDTYGRTPAHLASLKGRTDTVSLIISVNPNMSNAKDTWHRNPEHLARKQNHIETAEILTKHGVNNNDPDIFGITPEDLM